MREKPKKKELALKAAIYRAFVVAYEAALAFALGLLGFTVTGFVVANNLIKLAGYLLFELWWAGYLRTKLRLLDRLLKKLN